MDATLEALRTGLVVNWVLIAFAATISAAHEFAVAPSNEAKQVLAAVREELKGSFVNIGFAVYVSAGSAFLGSIPFSAVDFENHGTFFFSWLLFGLFLITLELASQKLYPRTADWTLSRLGSILVGGAFSYWVWSGATVS